MGVLGVGCLSVKASIHPHPSPITHHLFSTWREKMPNLTIRPTAQEVIDEGQIMLCYFPTLTTNEDLLGYVDTRINFTDAAFRHQLKSVYTDAETAANSTASGTNLTSLLFFTPAEMWMTLGNLWKAITAMMAGFAGSELPRDYIDPKEAAEIRDKYIQDANLSWKRTIRLPRRRTVSPRRILGPREFRPKPTTRPSTGVTSKMQGHIRSNADTLARSWETRANSLR